MPEIESNKVKLFPAFDEKKHRKNIKHEPDYAELQVVSNFSFLVGASHAEELVATASENGTKAIAITDYNSLAGIVRAHAAAKNYPIQYIVGTRLQLEVEGGLFTVLAYPTDRKSYGNLCRVLTKGKHAVAKDQMSLSVEDFLEYQQGLHSIIIPPYGTHDYQVKLTDSFLTACEALKGNASDKNYISLAIQKTYTNDAKRRLARTVAFGKKLSIPLVVTNDVHYHAAARHKLQEVLTCIKHKTTLEQAGHTVFQNSERYLKTPTEMWRLFNDFPDALRRTVAIAEQSATFSLDQLSYEYPVEICPVDQTPATYLRTLVEQGIGEKYPAGIPEKVRNTLEDELSLISELQYEKYFLTCYDIVKFARKEKILCQGRGAAANSVVCFCLGITAVNPVDVDLLFARFVSKERSEPPDIDIDFEHERRDEVIQHIYKTYGREHAGLVAGVVTYRHRSAVREVGKVLGMSTEVVDTLAKSIHYWTGCEIDDNELKKLNLDRDSIIFKNLLSLTEELIGFPRHLTQHVGGFIISRYPLCETVPIVNAAMAGRTIIEWDKDDIDVLNMLKIDVLALGMLTCVRKAMEFINAKREREQKPAMEVHDIQQGDVPTYNMICKADTIGVFQIESRAQMSMLPRLKPRKFYDLVIQVAIVRPGPIHGNMVHPYLKRRNGIEKVEYPDNRIKEILHKTLGVPLFQEQAMRLAIVLAGFTPGEAEKLRRAMAAWKRNEGVIASFKDRIVKGMLNSGLTKEFAETCMDQLKGFAEYGFPESHAASFAMITYLSCWIKCHHPAEFACALLNSQPMGFYSPAQIISDARTHNIQIYPVDINFSSYDNSMEAQGIRIGMRQVSGVSEDQATILAHERAANGNYLNILNLWHRCESQGLKKTTLLILAKADAFNSLGKIARQAIWEIQSFVPDPTVIEKICPEKPEQKIALDLQTKPEQMFQDYHYTGFSLKAHPMQFIRGQLTNAGVSSALSLRTGKHVTEKMYVSVAGLAIVRQRPGTARGVCFVTLEDETGIVNLVIKPPVFDANHHCIIMSKALIASGTLDRLGDVLYITVNKINGLDSAVFESEVKGLPSKSYSY